MDAEPVEMRTVGAIAEAERVAPPKRRTFAAHNAQHHVSNSYGYVRTDLLTVAAVGAVVIAFIVGMSFVL